jgi:hypothetical protein
MGDGCASSDLLGGRSAGSMNSPRGVTGLHLKTSRHTASTSGNLGRSSKVGSRSLPVTESSCFCTIVCMSGRIKAAAKNTIMEAKVYETTVQAFNSRYLLSKRTVSVPAGSALLSARFSGHRSSQLACIHRSQSSGDCLLCLLAFWSLKLLRFLQILKSE